MASGSQQRCTSSSSGTATTEDAVQFVVEEMLERGLHNAAAWLAELLLSVPTAALQQQIECLPRGPALDGISKTKHLFARALFEKQEFQRCAFHLEGVTHPKCVFLCCYALFMDHQKQTLVSQSSGTPATQLPPSAPLSDLRTLLTDAVTRHPEDSYLHWLLGVVHRELHDRQAAASHLTTAVALNPLLWCGWKDLSPLVTKEAQLVELLEAHGANSRAPSLDDSGSGGNGGSHSPFSWMRSVFSALVRTELQQATEARNEWENLLQLFPGAAYLRCQLGTSLYLKKEHDAARAVYAGVHAQDPCRLEGMDDYSNVLFIQGDRLGLSLLAQECFAVDPFRAESNCIAGNYYAIMRRHDKSLTHFRRAVAIDPKYISAWTLMGHEYLEVKNSHAAVEAYRTAIELDQRDYRAWYGLGQIYELLQLYHYALHYYWHTTTVRPNDSRMWNAVAGCLERQFRMQEALACLERAEAVEPMASDYYPPLCRRIADHFAAENPAKAAAYYEKLLVAEHRKPDDIVTAASYMINRLCTEAHEALQIPSRSPSFDVSVAVPTRSAPRASTEHRKAAAMTALATAESYMDMAESNCDSLAPQEANAAQQRLQRMKSDIDHIRRFL